MRVAALYDVHGNLPALDAVLAEVEAERVDRIVAGGDVASGPMPVETLERLRAVGATFVRGNADRVLDFEGGAAGPREVWMEARRDHSGHAGRDAAAVARGSGRACRRLRPHTRPVRPAPRRLPRRERRQRRLPLRIAAGAYWAVLGPDVSFRYTPYDVEDAVRRIRATGYPRSEYYVGELRLGDPERRDRMSKLIEGLP